MEGENNNGLLTTTTTNTQSIFHWYNSLVRETEETGTTTSTGDRGLDRTLIWLCIPRVKGSNVTRQVTTGWLIDSGLIYNKYYYGLLAAAWKVSNNHTVRKLDLG